MQEEPLKSISLFNSMGSEVFRRSLPDNQTVHLISFPSRLPVGIYFLVVILENRSVYHQKVIRK